MERRVLKTDPKMAKAAVEFLGAVGNRLKAAGPWSHGSYNADPRAPVAESVGLTSQEICNMCSISAQFLGRTPDELRPIITYVADKVDRNKALTRKAIAENPKMLEYNVDASKEFLVKPHGGRCTVRRRRACTEGRGAQGEALPAAGMRVSSRRSRRRRRTGWTPSTCTSGGRARRSARRPCLPRGRGPPDP